MKHGGGRRGSARDPEYVAWQNMKKRCYNHNNADYPNYGGRGIGVCPEWVNNYTQFLMDVGRRPSNKYTLDRIDNDGDYTKDNCRWASRLQQRHNQRLSVRTILIDGKTMKELSKETGTPYETIRWRYLRGKPILG